MDQILGPQLEHEKPESREDIEMEIAVLEELLGEARQKRNKEE